MNDAAQGPHPHRRRLASAIAGTSMALIAAVTLVACSHSDTNASPSSSAARSTTDTTATNRALVTDFYNRFFNEHDASAASVIADNYKQHNPQVPDGKAPFVDYFTGYFAQNPQARNTIVRSAADGDLVYLHVHSTNGARDRGQAIVDIFRVSGGKIVEHWDVIQDVPATSANNNTMF